jgi:3-O-alpha-D-mannopyranosyl-alpha-D-mannopyranose xylosylphosphotransferase
MPDYEVALKCRVFEISETDILLVYSDVTWLWVNGSDPRWEAQMIAEREAKGIYSPAHHFRENNELMYSMRSVLANMPGRLRTFHLITADYAFDTRTDLQLLPKSPEALRELESLAEQKFRPDGKWTKSGKPTAAVEEDGLEQRDVDDDLESRKEQPTARKPRVISSKLSGWLNSAWRVAQVPTWLNFERIDLADPQHPLHHFYQNPSLPKKPVTSHLHTTSHPSLRYAVHSEIFHLPTHKKSATEKAASGLGAPEYKEDEWKKNALPTFNSMAIESKIGWLWGLSDVSLALNDDQFFLKPYAVSDWWSGIYGTVLRLDYNYNQQVRPLLDKKFLNNAGENGGLYHANWLLSQRFPKRLRPYFAHVPKVITRGLHHEASIMFKDALTTSAQRKFRELVDGEGDVHMQWLLMALRIERWREAMLWTWAVARVGTRPAWGENKGGQIGIWGDEARDDIKELFGVTDEDDDVIEIEVTRGERWTMEKDRMAGNLEGAGWEAPKNTEFLWCEPSSVQIRRVGSKLTTST